MRNKRFPNYPDDVDYTTNTPSYYDDLARKQTLIQILAEKVAGYDEELSKRFLEWDKNLEDFPEDVELLLQEWLDNGTLEFVLSNALLNTKSNIVLSRTEPTHINDQTYWFQIKSTENIIDLDDNISFEILS